MSIPLSCHYQAEDQVVVQGWCLPPPDLEFQGTGTAHLLDSTRAGVQSQQVPEEVVTHTTGMSSSGPRRMSVYASLKQTQDTTTRASSQRFPLSMMYRHTTLPALSNN